MTRATGWLLRLCGLQRNLAPTRKANRFRALRARRVFFEPLEDRRLLATITVTSLEDNVTVDGQITLREAIQAANTDTSVDGSPAGSGDDTIEFAPNVRGTINTFQAGGEYLITTSLTISGPGADDLSVNARGMARLFNISANTTVQISGLTLAQGEAIEGGAIYSRGNLTVTDSLIKHNFVPGRGAGIYAFSGELLITNSTFLENAASDRFFITQDSGIGGAIYNRSGKVTITNSTLSGNTGEIKGGGIYNESGEVIITNSTLSGNEAAMAGGGVFNRSGTLTIANSTISGNKADNIRFAPYYDDASGGAVFNDTGTVRITNSTLSGNRGKSKGGGIFDAGGVVDIANSTLSENDSDLAGGGLYLKSGSAATITNSTISGNAASIGGGIFNYGTVAMSHSTVSGNVGGLGGGGVYSIRGSSTTLSNTIVAGNLRQSMPSDVTGLGNLEPPSAFNLVGDAATAGGLADGDANQNIVGVDWKLVLENDGTSPILKDNGGATQTIAIVANASDPGRDALEAGDPNAVAGQDGVPAFDQRGVVRVFNRMDIGAFEASIAPVITWNAPANIGYGTLLNNTQLNATADVPGSFFYTPANGTLLNAGANQQLSVLFKPTDTAVYRDVIANVTIDVLKADPIISWSDPTDITFGILLSDTQLNATSEAPGSFVYTPASGEQLDAGADQQLSVAFTPTDTVNYNDAVKNVTINVAKAVPIVTWNNPDDIVFGTPLGDTQLNATSEVPGSFDYTPVSGEQLNAGADQQLSVAFTPSDTVNYNNAVKNVTINVAKAVPIVTWNNPDDIVFGTPLGDTQLNATSEVPGSFVYTPASGEQLNAGADQQLSVAFTPTDTVNYNDAVKNVTINVAKADPNITWNNPDDIVFGTPLGDTQLNAMSEVPGSFVYTPASGEQLNAGADQQLSVAFTPTDTVNYNDAVKNVTINVAKADPNITWNNPDDITFGTLLGSVQLNATADIAGSFVYTPASGEQLDTGLSQQLAVAFTPVDTANFNDVTASVTINVLAPILDFGDAPTAAQSGFASDYPVTLAQNGARHIGGALFLGGSIDVEADGQPDIAAGQVGSGGDDGHGLADEDGVSVIANLVATASSATASSFSVVASQAGKLDAWIDFDQDGVWDHPGEQVLASVDVVEGTNLLSFGVPAGATPGTTFVRFRLSSAGALLPTGAADDGEVEDYLVTILDGDVAGGAAVEIHSPVSGTLDVVAEGNDIVVRSDAIELFRGAGSKLGRLDIFGTDGDDTLNLANLDAIFSGFVGGNAGAGNDTLRLTGDGQTLDLTQILDSGIQGFETIDITGSGSNILRLNVNEVLNISTTTETLRVVHDEDDTVIYGADWTVELPQIIAGQFVHVLTQANATIEVVNTTPFRNPFRPLDTNRDGSVVPQDALIIINRLNTIGSGSLKTPTSIDALTQFFYVDPTGDGSVAPIDVLLVVNFLNNPVSNPEGEDQVAVMDLVAVPQASERHFTRTDISVERSNGVNRLGLRRSPLRPARPEYNFVPAEGEQMITRQTRTPPQAADNAAALEQVLREDIDITSSLDDLLRP